MERREYEEVKAVLREMLELQQLLARRLVDTPSAPDSHRLRGILERMAAEVEHYIEDRLYLACQRINLRDQRYPFMRAIDGDTLELHPPDELKEWMRDVHIRLYGIDTPERNEDQGPAYTSLLERLCRNCAGGNLSVIWERERGGTEYAGYPRTSFERGIANIFFSLDEKVIYLNALLAMLPHVKTRRSNGDLIRGRRWLENLRLPYRGHCPNEVPGVIIEAIRTTELAPISPGLPACLYTFPPEIIPASARSPREVWEIVSGSIRTYSCPFAAPGIPEQEIMAHIDEERISPFDIPLILASEWRQAMGV